MSVTLRRNFTNDERWDLICLASSQFRSAPDGQMAGPFSRSPSRGSKEWFVGSKMVFWAICHGPYEPWIIMVVPASGYGTRVAEDSIEKRYLRETCVIQTSARCAQTVLSMRFTIKLFLSRDVLYRSVWDDYKQDSTKIIKKIIR